MSMIDKELATIAFCWRLERRDGITLGYTSHDRDLTIAGLVYRAAPGMLPSAIALSDDFEGASLDVRGALSGEAITGTDLAAGRWDGAAICVFMADWDDPGATPVEIARGELGDVGVRREAFEAELRGLAPALDRPVVEQTSPECRAELGDKRCRVDLGTLTHLARITGVPSDTEVAVAPVPAGAQLGNGTMRWISGPNSGVRAEIAASDAGTLTLRDVPPFAPSPSDLVEIVEGCDKSITTCGSRFGNAVNFRGEPDLPGMDLLTRYPGA